jgi:hypothetical protein
MLSPGRQGIDPTGDREEPLPADHRTPAYRDFIDSRIGRLPAEMTEFRNVFREGAPEERKAFIRAFVPEIVLEPGVPRCGYENSRRPVPGAAGIYPVLW